jgi:hypothetical protein
MTRGIAGFGFSGRTAAKRFSRCRFPRDVCSISGPGGRTPYMVQREPLSHLSAIARASTIARCLVMQGGVLWVAPLQQESLAVLPGMRRSRALRGVATRSRLLRPSGRRCLLPLRLLIGLRQGIRGLELVFLRHPGVYRRRLHVRVAKLLLDNLQVVAADSVQVRGIGVAAGMGGVPGIQADRCHEALDDPPHPIPGEGPPLAGE